MWATLVRQPTSILAVEAVNLVGRAAYNDEGAQACNTTHLLTGHATLDILWPSLHPLLILTTPPSSSFSSHGSLVIIMSPMHSTMIHAPFGLDRTMLPCVSKHGRK